MAQREAQGGEALTVSAQTLRKRLKEKGLLASVSETRQTLLVRRTLEGVKDRSVLHLHLSSLFSDWGNPTNPMTEAISRMGKGIRALLSRQVPRIRLKNPTTNPTPRRVLCPSVR